MRRPRMKDVAELANVSLTTASLVLSGKGNISNDVKERVIQASASIGYVRRRRAHGDGEVQDIVAAVLLPFDTLWKHVFTLVRPTVVEISEAFERDGHHVAVIPVDSSGREESIMGALASCNAEAVFSVHYGNTRLFRRLEAMGKPVVVVNNSEYQDEFYTVGVDDYRGAYDGCMVLIDFGHQRIGYIDYLRPELPVTFTDRYVGFMKAMQEHSLPFDDSRRITINPRDIPTLRKKLMKICSGSSRPTAFFVHDDYLGASVYTEMQKMGFRIPEDVSIISPGDVLDYEETYLPQISTMSADMQMIGRVAAGLMSNRLVRGDNDIHALKVPQSFVDRGSCGPPPA